MSSYLDQQGAAYTIISDDEIKELASDGPSSIVARASPVNSTIAATRSKLAAQFVKLILQVAISPPKAHIIKKIATLPHPTPEVISDLIKDLDPSQSSSDVEDACEDDGGPDQDQNNWRGATPSSPSPHATSVFQLEEELFKVTAQLKRRNGEVECLELERQALDDAYERLEENYEAIKKQSAEVEDQLKKITLAHSDRDKSSPRELEDKISQQEEVIRGQESQIKEHQSREAELRRKADKFTNTEVKLREKEDELDIQKRELEKQTRMANAGEKYKQKVQANQAIEKERDSLRAQFDEARPKLKAYEDIRRHNTRLEKENQEIHRALSGSERDNSQLRETKQSVIAENDRLRRESIAMREALARNLESIAILEDGSGGSEIHSSPTIVNCGLESELTESYKHEQQMQVAGTLLWWARGLMRARKIRISELEKDNCQLESAANGKDDKATALQRQLDSIQDLSANQSAKEQRLRQDISSLESSITDVRQGHPIEGSVSPAQNIVNLAHAFESTEIFRRLRAQLNDEQKKSGELEEKLSIAQKDIDAATNDRMSAFDRHCMMAELTIDLLEGELVGKPKLEMIERVKRQYAIALTQLQGEHGALRKRYNRLQEESDKLWEERNQAWRLSYDTVVAKTKEDLENATTRLAHQQLTDFIMQASKDTTDSIRNSTDISQKNLQVINAKIEEGYATQIEGSRERIANAQKVDRQLFESGGTSIAPPQSAPHLTSFKGVRKFFGPKDADKIELPDNRGPESHDQRSPSSYRAATR